MRIVIAVLFMCHGGQKLFAYPGTINPVVPPLSLIGVSGMLELFGGLFILLGLFTRPVAFLLCGEMAVAYCMAHAVESWHPFALKAFWPIHNKGELAVVYCFVFLYLSVAGAGPLSLDGLLCKKRPETPAPAAT
jgi:putative oxidoreductase